MRHTWLALLALCFSYTAWGHESHGSFGEMAETYDLMAETLYAHLYPSGTNSAPPNLGHLHIGPDDIAFNLSAMQQLMALASLHSIAEAHSPRVRLTKLQQAWKFGKWVMKLPVEVGKFMFWNLPVGTFHFAQHPIQNTVVGYRSFRLFSEQFLKGYDPTLVFLIAATQLTWEGVESVVMGGAHWACTIFNGLLLAAVMPIEKVMQLSRNRGAGLSLPERLRTSLSAVYLDLFFSLAKSRAVHFDTKNGTYSANRNTFEATTRSELDELMLDTKMFEPVFISRFLQTIKRANLSSYFENAWLMRDLEIVFDPTHTEKERFFVAKSHILGFRVFHKILEGLVHQAKDEGILDYNSLLRLQQLTARMRRIVTNYSSTLLFYAARPLNEKKAAQVKYFRRFLHQYLLFWAEIGVSIQLHRKSLEAGPQPESHPISPLLRTDFTESELFFEQAMIDGNKSAKHIFRKLLVLRSRKGTKLSCRRKIGRAWRKLRRPQKRLTD